MHRTLKLRSFVGMLDIFGDGFMANYATKPSMILFSWWPSSPRAMRAPAGFGAGRGDCAAQTKQSKLPDIAKAPDGGIGGFVIGLLKCLRKF